MGSTDPKCVEFDISGGSGATIEWADGHRSRYSLFYLRDACPCALCAAKRQREGRGPGDSKTLTLEDLMMAAPPPKLARVERVGNYALRLVWSDGHQEGDYTWVYLRDICHCRECRPSSSPLSAC